MHHFTHLQPLANTIAQLITTDNIERTLESMYLAMEALTTWHNFLYPSFPSDFDPEHCTTMS